MAGKKKGSLRQKRRAKEISEEFTEVTANVEKSKLIESKKDEELFVVDTVGTGKKDLSKSKNKRRKVNKIDDNDNNQNHDQDQETKEERLKKVKEEKRKKKKELPKLIGKKVKKIVETHQVDTIQNMMNAGRKKRNPNELRRATNKAKSTNFDLWEEDNKDVNNVNKAKKLVPMILSTSAPAGTAPVMLVPVEKNQQEKNNQKKKAVLFITGNSTKMVTDPTSSSSSNTKLKNVQHKLNQKKKQVAVEICHPGQSYKPDEEHHQDAIGEALAIEIKRKEAIAYKEGPLGGTDGLSEKTLSVMIHSSDEEDEDSSDDENTNTEATSTTFKKRQEKLTRAQRNKQKRHKQMLASHKLLKKNKKLLSDIHPSNTKTVLKKIRKHEEDLKEKKKVVTQLKLEKEKIPQGSNMYHKLMNEDPVRVPSLPVALTEDLKKKDDNGDGDDTYGLRTVKPKGSLIQERLHSLIDRKMAGKRTYKRKNLVQGKKKKPGKLGNTMIW